MFKQLRVAFLLYVLLTVALTSWSTRARNTDWQEPLWVVIYPINGDGGAKMNGYIQQLSESQFAPIETVIRDEAQRFEVSLEKPIDIKLAPAVDSLPPSPPASSNPLAVAYWSLRLRWWAWRSDTFDGPHDIRLFAVFHDPDKHEVLAHSLGLQKGFLGVVHGYGDADYNGNNNVVLAHEMLHTLGASDKYNPVTNQALYPIGFAEPARSPLYPQAHAEIMAGRIPLTAEESKMPKNLRQTVIGRETALEIGWLK